MLHRLEERQEVDSFFVFAHGKLITRGSGRESLFLESS
jgi:hypothetical protein